MRELLSSFYAQPANVEIVEVIGQPLGFKPLASLDLVYLTLDIALVFYRHLHRVNHTWRQNGAFFVYRREQLVGKLRALEQLGERKSR